MKMREKTIAARTKHIQIAKNPKNLARGV